MKRVVYKIMTSQKAPRFVSEGF